jgi:hypothetical protein
VKGVQKGPRLSLLYHHKRNVLFKLFNSYHNVSYSLRLALFHASKMKQCVMLVIHRVHNDAMTSGDIFIPCVNSGMIFLALCDLSAILKISGYMSYILFIRHDPTSLEIDLLVDFIVYCIFKVSFFKDRGLYKMRHLCH